MTTLSIHPSSIHKQFLINKLDKNLPKDLCEIIKSYCFYDSKTYEMLCNMCRFRAMRILNADFFNSYKFLMFFFWYISCYSIYFYSNLYYKHK